MRIAVTTLLLLALAPPLKAQSGSGGSSGYFSQTLSYGYIEGNEGKGELERHWLRAIVVWREPKPRYDQTRGAYPAYPREAILRYRALEAAAEDARRAGLGARGVPIRWAEYDATTLYVEGRRYALPFPPHTLVVIVDVGEKGDSTNLIVYTGMVPSTLPDGFWGRNWRRGDTLLIYPGARDKEAMLLAYLRAVPEVARLLP